MTATGTAVRQGMATLSFWHVFVALVVLTVLRIAGLHLSVVDLYFDEAQYWAWSRELAFGYFSKPPLLPWIIAASDLVCGSGEACTRVASPVIYFASSLVMYAIANALYDQRTAGWCALTFALATGLSFSTRIISTDVPLIFFWVLALLAYIKLLPRPDWRWAVVLGLACGLGMLAKYAMLYFVLCALFAACFDREARSVLTRPQTWIALAIAAVILAPNIYWNVSNQFVTLGHTGENIMGAALRFRPLDALNFFGSQFALSGPLIFAAFLVILFKIRSAPLVREDWLMLAFAIPPLALVTALAFVRSAHPNWAATSIPSMIVLVVAWWLRNGQRQMLNATLVIGLIVQLALLAGDSYADRITVPPLGRKADLYQRTLGWRALGDHARELARSAHAPTVAAETRADVAALIYYLRNDQVRVVSWPLSSVPRNHFDLTRALDNSAAEPILLISRCAITTRLKHFFQEVTPLGSLTARSGPSSGRNYHAFKLANRRRAMAPRGPCS